MNFSRFVEIKTRETLLFPCSLTAAIIILTAVIIIIINFIVMMIIISTIILTQSQNLLQLGLDMRPFYVYL